MTQTQKTQWFIYLLASGTKTYVGSTTNPFRRLRQHNGEIRGGARSTRGRHWLIMCAVGGFQDRSSACRWEKLVKGRARGFERRYQAMLDVAGGLCPAYRNRPYYEPPPDLTFYQEDILWAPSWEHTQLEQEILNA